MNGPVIIAVAIRSFVVGDGLQQISKSATDGPPSQLSQGTICGKGGLRNYGAIDGPAGPPKVPQVIRGTTCGSHK